MAKWQITRNDMDKLAFDLAIIKEKAMRIGMVKTSHALETAVRAVGWEMAEILGGTHGATVLHGGTTPGPSHTTEEGREKLDGS